jgi:hypothetical protein
MPLLHYAAGAFAGFLGGVLALAHHRGLKPFVSEDAVVAKHDLDGAIAQGVNYEPGTRDCEPGELHDFLDEEIAPEDESADGNEDASGGKRGRGPATRRLYKRKKFVHETMAGGVASSAYLGHIIAEARNIYASRAATSNHVAAARLFLARLMKEHGMRPTHINSKLDACVLAVFYVTDEERATEKAWDELRRVGRIRTRGLI